MCKLCREETKGWGRVGHYDTESAVKQVEAGGCDRNLFYHRINIESLALSSRNRRCRDYDQALVTPPARRTCLRVRDI